MAQEGSLTPEKQLLNLIESPKAKNSGNQPHGPTHHGIWLFSSSVWKGKIAYLKDKLKKYFTKVRLQPDLKLFNRILVVIIGLVIFYLVNVYYKSIINMRKTPSLKVSSHGDAAQVERFKEASVLKQSIAYYMDKIKQRNIFKIGAKKVSEKDAPVALTPKIVEATQHLRLVGISWSNEPDAMIEDTKALKTFFIKRGQMLGQVKIEAIFKDKVVLSYDGEETELR